MKKSLLIFSIILALSVALTGCSTAQKVSGTHHNSIQDFSEGISVDEATVINGSGQYVGAVNGTTGAFSGAVSGTTGNFSSTLGVTGATALSSTLAVTSTSTLTGNLDANGTFNAIGDAATSTAQIGKANNAGCLILGDSSGGASPVYIISSGATITASTTKPAACQTAR